MENWTTLSINKKTTKIVEQLAALITVKEGRPNKCSKHEAIHKGSDPNDRATKAKRAMI